MHFKTKTHSCKRGLGEEDRAEPVQTRLLQDVSERYVSLFVAVSQLLDMLLIVNASAYVSF